METKSQTWRQASTIVLSSIISALSVLWVTHSVRSNFRSSHRSAGMDDIWVPDRVLEFEAHRTTFATVDPEERRRDARTVTAHLQTLQVAGGRQDGEVVHHAGPPQHSARHRVGPVSIDGARGKRFEFKCGTHNECSSDRFWKAEAPTEDNGLSYRWLRGQEEAAISM